MSSGPATSTGRHGSLAFRLTLWYAAIHALSAALALGVVHAVIVGIVEERARDDLHEDVESSPEYGLGEVKYRETKSHQTFNRYRFVSIPLLVGYEIPLFGRSSLHFEGGLATSIMSAHSGKVMQDGSISSFETRKIGVLQSVSSFHYQVKRGRDEAAGQRRGLESLQLSPRSLS